jgi:hypothetical protein
VFPDRLVRTAEFREELKSDFTPLMTFHKAARSHIDKTLHASVSIVKERKEQ